MAAACPATSEEEFRRIELEVMVRHRGRLRELTIHRVEGGVVLLGRAVSFYGKQIAFHEVKTLLDELVIGNRIAVDVPSRNLR